MPVCVKRTKKERNGQASANQGSLQPAKTVAMCTACHDYAHPPPLVPSFLLVQNLSSKQIAPTDTWPSEAGQLGQPSHWTLNLNLGLRTIYQNHFSCKSAWSIITELSNSRAVTVSLFSAAWRIKTLNNVSAASEPFDALAPQQRHTDGLD